MILHRMFSRRLAVLTLLLVPSQILAQDGSGTCSEDSPCYQGCCSKDGYCGFGTDFCGDDVCISDCDAQAECGGLSFFLLYPVLL
jgi:chitinase